MLWSRGAEGLDAFHPRAASAASVAHAPRHEHLEEGLKQGRHQFADAPGLLKSFRMRT